MKVAVALLFLLLIPSHPALGQDSTPPTAAKKAPQSKPLEKAKLPATGELTGFVFAITNAGDLKPARLASVVLLWSPVVRDAETSNSAGMEYKRNTVKQMQHVLETIKNGRLFGEAGCQAELKGHIDALTATVNWITAQPKSEFNKELSADEEGRFKITGIPEGRYTLVAAGQTGVNYAFWEKEEVVITAGQITEVKLSSPTKSCLTQ